MTQAHLSPLGHVHYDAAPREGILLANMVAQRGVGRRKQRVDYAFLERCLEQVCAVARPHVGGWKMWPVHMPRIGCGLGGGSWDEVEPIVRRTLVVAGVDVVVYDLPEAPR